MIVNIYTYICVCVRVCIYITCPIVSEYLEDISGLRACNSLWKLGSRLLQEKYVERLRKQADGVSIELVAGASRSQVAGALSKARVYWQLTGLEVRHCKSRDPAAPAASIHSALSAVGPCWLK